MKQLSAGLAALFALSLPAVALAQPTGDESDPAPGDLQPDDGSISHESDEVIGPDDAPQPVEPTEVKAAAATKQVGYDKGFFLRSEDGKNEIKFKGRLQPYFTFSRGLDSDGKHDLRGGFEVRRARFNLEGHLHGDNILYKAETDFGKGTASLKDFIVDIRLSGDTWLRFGQWKRPFSRQQMTSDAKLETTDRSITDKAFGAERDIGLALRNDYEASVPIEWTFGVFNGFGVGTRPIVNADGATTGFTNIPTEFKPAFIGRIGLNSEKAKGYSEADLEGGPLRWSAGASAWIETDFDKDDQSNDKVELDYLIKANGFSTSGALYMMTRQTDVQTLSSQELAYIGFHLQAGYMFAPKWQAAARYAFVDGRPDDLRNTSEITVAGSYYGYGHDAKLQVGLTLLKPQNAEFADSILLEVETNVGF